MGNGVGGTALFLVDAFLSEEDDLAIQVSIVGDPVFELAGYSLPVLLAEIAPGVGGVAGILADAGGVFLHQEILHLGEGINDDCLVLGVSLVVEDVVVNLFKLLEGGNLYDEDAFNVADAVSASVLNVEQQEWRRPGAGKRTFS